jgi:hypothetical protein
MGKTSLAKAILHLPEITARYEQNRFFVASDSAATSVNLASLIASCLSLQPGKNPTNTVLKHFDDGPSCLLILDNLETAWEVSRADVEEFLALLTSISHLALLVG